MRRKLDHAVPDWIVAEPEFFITLCAKNRGLNIFCHPQTGSAILESVQWRNNQQKWFCSLALLMPDHIHLIIQFPADTAIEKPIRDWKAWLARRHGIEWQPDFFDHRLRNEKSADEKARYIVLNPVRAGLVEKTQDWPYVWISPG